MTVEEAFRNRLVEERKRRGWSQAELSRRVTALGRKIEKDAMSKIEKGTRRVTLADAVALAAALDVPLDALLVPQGPDEVALTERLRVRMPIALAWLRGMSPLRVESVENYRAPADFIMRGRGIAEVFPLLVEAGPNEDEREALQAYAAERRSRAAWLQDIASRLDRTDPLRVELREKVQVERDEADEIEALLLKETKE